MNLLIQNSDLNFSYNPFGVISDSELAQVIVPTNFIKEIHRLIHPENKLIIELVGAKGRGKTSHLKLIQQQYPNAPIFLLNSAKEFENIKKNTSNLIFIDSIHQLSLKQRLKLFKQNKTIVLTTHWPRYFEYSIAKATFKSYAFKGISPQKLALILQNRVGLASNIPPAQIILNQRLIKKLIHQFKDDYRGILNYLYEEFNFIPHQGKK